MVRKRHDRPHRLVVIVGDPVLRRSVRDFLTGSGFEVVVFTSCDELPDAALDADGVLLDVAVLDEACLSLLRTVRERIAEAPVLLLADYGSILDDEWTSEVGTVRLLTKPFAATTLDFEIHSLVAST